MKDESIPNGRCLLIIPSPSDEAVYECFRSIGRQWRDSVTSEALWIAGDVPISACLTTPLPSSALLKMRESGSDIISRIDLGFGGLQISFMRSGGQGPALFRQSFFDEIRAQCDGTSSISAEDLVEVVYQLCDCLKARRGIGTAQFTEVVGKAHPRVTMDVCQK